MKDVTLKYLLYKTIRPSSEYRFSFQYSASNPTWINQSKTILFEDPPWGFKQVNSKQEG